MLLNKDNVYIAAPTFFIEIQDFASLRDPSLRSCLVVEIRSRSAKTIEVISLEETKRTEAGNWDYWGKVCFTYVFTLPTSIFSFALDILQAAFNVSSLPLPILIVSETRSGSTLLADFLYSFPGIQRLSLNVLPFNFCQPLFCRSFSNIWTAAVPARTHRRDTKQ